MGAKQTKCEGIYLPETPVGLKKYSQQTPPPLTLTTEFCCATENSSDPRSPYGNRTPILLPVSASTTKPKPSLTAVLRKRLAKGFHCNLLDPRSPSQQVLRTPLAFEDGTERTFTLDDTFADLLVETRVPEEPKTEHVTIDKSEEAATQPDNSLSFVSMASEEAPTQEHTPITSFTQVSSLDPRSPTVGVERTPLIFTDDDNEEQLEYEMLEDVLAKLSLDLSSAAEHSLLSLGPVTNNTDDLEASESQVKAPTNKHLERVRVPKKPARLRRPNNANNMNNVTPPSTKIYEDCENISPIANNKSFVNEAKRTPLSCVGNQVKQGKKAFSQLDKIKHIKAYDEEDKIDF